MNRNKHNHTDATKAKIAASNTGKVFSEERRRNIGKAREIVLSSDQIEQLRGYWLKRYVPSCWIRTCMGLSNRVYRRVLKTYCDVAQIKFLPQQLNPTVFEAIIEHCMAGMPYKEIATSLLLNEKQVRAIILKLAPFYGIAALPKPRPAKTLEQREALRQRLRLYNVANPKKGENNPSWKGGVTELSDSIRKSDRYKTWRFHVMKRDGFTCIVCDSKQELHVDHMYPFVLLLEDGKITTVEEALLYGPLWNLANGRVMCAQCHRKTDAHGRQARKRK